LIVVDLQGTQSVDHRDRGVARYCRELALGLERLDPSIVGAYTLHPRLPLPAGLEPIVGSGKLKFVDEVDWTLVDRFHLTSPIELSIPLDSAWPRAARDARLSVTLFDLVPLVLADTYLADPGLRRRYSARVELVRHADLVLAISRSAAKDGVRLLKLGGDAKPQQVRVVELAASGAFVADAGLAREPFVLYTGGTDARKNVERLLEAWARVRTRHQLVIACSVKPLEQNHYEVMADRLGFRDRLTVTGWVPEAELVRLTQTATLAIYPSLYEGFGLPIAEALACGTPAIGSDSSSLPELLPPDALFDPTDVDSIANAIDRALNHKRHYASLTRWATERPRRTWDDVALETVEAFASASRRSRSSPGQRTADATRNKRTRLAFITPLPPMPGGVSDYSYRLLEELAKIELEGIEVHAFADGPPHERASIEEARVPPGVHGHRLGALDRVESLDGPFDAVVFSLGNSEFHSGALDALLQRGSGTVLAHDVRLTGLYRFAQWQHRDATPGGFHATLHRMYPALPAALGSDEELGSDEKLDAEDAERWGILMARGAIAASDRFIVTSAFAANLARLDALPGDRDKIAVLPFSVGAVPVDAPVPIADRPGPPLIASFGVVNDRKRTALLADAMRVVHETHPRARLVFVGPSEASSIEGAEVTGMVDADEYRRWLDTGWIAVQLRTATNGESSGAVGDCLAAGVPTIVTAIGAARDLPDDAVVKVPSDIDAPALAARITALLDDAGARAALHERARAYAADHSFVAAARELYRVLFG
jgi:glycosyltransferase involved in cell wall biosynthesis